MPKKQKSDQEPPAGAVSKEASNSRVVQPPGAARDPSLNDYGRPSISLLEVAQIVVKGLGWAKQCRRPACRRVGACKTPRQPKDWNMSGRQNLPACCDTNDKSEHVKAIMLALIRKKIAMGSAARSDSEEAARPNARRRT
jgi:hypothetical protein